MKKLLLIIAVSCLFLSGCSTYSFKKGASPYNQGYVVARYGRTLPEYTLGKDNSVPSDKQLAEERFRRRRAKVEYYYKKMGYIENRFRQMFVDPPLFMLESVLGVFRMPFRLASDYKYNHDPKYKEKMDRQDDAEYKAEKERIKYFVDRLNEYVKEDLQKESIVAEQIGAVKKEGLAPPPEVKEPTVQESPATQEKPPAAKAQEKTGPGIATEVKAPATKELLVQEPPAAKESVPAEQAKEKAATEITSEVKEPEAKEPSVGKESIPEPEAKERREPAVAERAITLASPTAVIIAKPLKGASPLKVQFNAEKSSSPNGRIVSYSWDFGDGDTSVKKKPVNTYWSTTYGSRVFTVTLTVKDKKGAVASTTCPIEVLNQ